jgi:radical SAM superfamily enzyme YgiQ (UPF0313 family)
MTLSAVETAPDRTQPKGTPRVLIVSSSEAQLQPILAASVAGAFRAAGAEVSAWDADVWSEEFPGAEFDLVLISIPSYEGIQRGADLAARFKTAGCERVLVFGQYAWLNKDALLSTSDGVLMDEPEGLTDQLNAYGRGEMSSAEVPMLYLGGESPRRSKRTQRAWQLPARDLFPPISHYPQHQSPYGLIGNIEATRGCHHKCTFCAVYAAYEVAAIPITLQHVVDDAGQLADQGVEHFVFVDAEFFNTRKHALNALDAIAAEHPGSTFELTTRFDHIIEFEAEINAMVDKGLRTIISALEFPSNRLLEIFDKGIDVPGVEQAIAIAQRAGVELLPTFITFSPWVSLEEIEALDDWAERAGVGDALTPTARQTRLLLYKGSPLLRSPWIEGVELIDRGFYYDWVHPDPAVDALYEQRRAEAVDSGETRCCIRC